jgi:hypothetical protein
MATRCGVTLPPCYRRIFSASPFFGEHPEIAVFFQRTVMRKMRRYPVGESDEQSVVPGPIPRNPTPLPGTSIGIATFGSSHMLPIAGQRISPSVNSPTAVKYGIP